MEWWISCYGNMIMCILQCVVIFFFYYLNCLPLSLANATAKGWVWGLYI
jgi:hypothetical protein